MIKFHPQEKKQKLLLYPLTSHTHQNRIQKKMNFFLTTKENRFECEITRKFVIVIISVIAENIFPRNYEL